MDKNFKHKNSIVIGFNDQDESKRKWIIDVLTSKTMQDHVLHLASSDVLENRGVTIDDQFRDIEYGKVIKVLEVGFSFENSKPFAVCTDDDMHDPYIDIKYLDELLDIRRWAKMNQYEVSDD